MSVIKRLEPRDFKEYVRLTFEAYPSMSPYMSKKQVEVWIKRMRCNRKKTLI